MGGYDPAPKPQMGLLCLPKFIYNLLVLFMNLRILDGAMLLIVLKLIVYDPRYKHLDFMYAGQWQRKCSVLSISPHKSQ